MARQAVIAGAIAELDGLVRLCEQGSIGVVLPRQLLEGLGTLLEADVVEISGLNPVVQVAYLCGPDDGDCHRVLPTPDPTATPFWRHYWFTERSTVAGMRCEISLELADFAGRTVRLRCWRAHGPDFDDRSRMLLHLLKPHLEHAYRS